MGENDVYDGELDEENFACGEGIRIQPSGALSRGTYYKVNQATSADQIVPATETYGYNCMVKSTGSRSYS